MSRHQRLAIFAITWLLLLANSLSVAALPPDLALQSVTELPVPGQECALNVVLDGRPVTLNLVAWSVRAPGFRARVQAADGSLQTVAPPPPATWRGTVAGEPGSRVVASLVDGALQASVLLPGRDGEETQWWSISSARGVVPDAAPELMVVAREVDLPSPGGTCAVEGEPAPRATTAPATPDALARRFSRSPSEVFVLELACDADVEYLHRQRQFGRRDHRRHRGRDQRHVRPLGTRPADHLPGRRGHRADGGTRSLHHDQSLRVAHGVAQRMDGPPARGRARPGPALHRQGHRRLRDRDRLQRFRRLQHLLRLQHRAVSLQHHHGQSLRPVRARDLAQLRGLALRLHGLHLPHHVSQHGRLLLRDPLLRPLGSQRHPRRADRQPLPRHHGAGVPPRDAAVHRELHLAHDQPREVDGGGPRLLPVRPPRDSPTAAATAASSTSARCARCPSNSAARPRSPTACCPTASPQASG